MLVPAGMVVEAWVDPVTGTVVPDPLADDPEVAVELPVLGTTPAPAGGGVEAPVPQALSTSTAVRITNMDKYKFFFIFSPYIFPIAKILSAHL